MLHARALGHSEGALTSIFICLRGKPARAQVAGRPAVRIDHSSAPPATINQDLRAERRSAPASAAGARVVEAKARVVQTLDIIERGSRDVGQRNFIDEDVDAVEHGGTLIRRRPDSETAKTVHSK